MAAPSALKRIVLKNFRLLSSRGQKCCGSKCFSSSSGSKKDDQTSPQNVPKGLFRLFKMPPKRTELDPGVLENPERNTEHNVTHLDPRRQEHHDKASESRFKTQVHGQTDFMSWLYWDIDLDDNLHLISLMDKKKYQRHKENQRYVEEQAVTHGKEIAAAHFIVSLGGSIKFHNRDVWFKKDKNNHYSLPRVKRNTLYLEAIDASDMRLTYVAFDHLDDLSKLRYMKFHNCPYIDDWSLARLQRLRGSLEYLDISNCPNITDNGLTSLQCLHKLKVLRVANLPKVKFLGLITILLEEQLPELTVLGVPESDLKPTKLDHHGERRLVRALLGILDDEYEYERRYIIDNNIEEKGEKKLPEVLKRYVRKVD